MPTTKPTEPRQNQERQVRDTKVAAIGEQLIHTLGEPADLLQVQVRLLWADHYRVNVVVGRDAASAHVADSFFVRTDADGRVVTSTPKVVRRYGPVVAGPKAV